MIDQKPQCGTMPDAGGEDRALLRSNPSAPSGAGTGAGTKPWFPSGPSLFRLLSEKPKRPTASWPRSPRAVGHMSRSLGLWMGRAGM